MKRENYTIILDEQNVERHKCKCCGGDIFYDNSTVRVIGRGTSKERVVFSGKSFNTTKFIKNIPYKLQVCQDCLLKKFPNIRNLSRTFNVMSEQTKFAFDIPQEIFEKCRRGYAMTKEHMIEKYGEEAGLEKWNKYCARQAETNTFEYKRKKYGMTREEFDKYNASRASTLKNFISRYGEKLGTKKWNEYCERQSYTKSKEYILQKWGEEELQRILDDRMKGAMSYEYTGFSKISQKFFDELDLLLGNKYETYYKTKNDEYIVTTKRNRYMLDYYIKDLKIDIEFHGDYWHAHPDKFDDNFVVIKTNLTAKEIRKKDKERTLNLEKELGIKTYVIWESEYYNGMTAKEFIKRIPELQYINKTSN